MAIYFVQWHCGTEKNIPKSLYKHFLLYFVSLFCLSNPILYMTYCDYANNLLVLFVKHFGKFYGQNMLVYNVHCLVHLAGNVERFGPLDTFSAFPFENCLGSIKRVLRKPHLPLSQVI